MRTIYDQSKTKIAIQLNADEFKDGLTFFSAEEDFLQVGSWKYPQGKKLLAHIHNPAPRTIQWTQEFVFVVKGELQATLYDKDSTLIETLRLGPHDGLVLLAGGHGYEILKDDTVVIEVKNGPYVGAEQDRRRIESNASP